MNRQDPYEQSGTERAQQMADEARSRTEGAMEEARGRGEQIATATQERADQGMDRAAEGMEQASASLRQHAGDGATGKAAGVAADSMERGASYLRDKDSAEVWNDVEQYVGEHPAQALLGAVAAGFVIGRILR